MKRAAIELNTLTFIIIGSFALVLLMLLYIALQSGGLNILGSINETIK